MGWMTAAGGLLDIAGTAINAGEAGQRREDLEKIASTPGLDFGSLTQQALTGYDNVFEQAAALAGKVGTAQQTQLQKQEEMALPGVGAARQQALQAAEGLFADDASWLKGVQRRGAALGLSSGLFGSQAGQLQTLRLSDQEKMQRTQLGTSLLGSLIRSMRLANSPGVQTFLGPAIQEQVAQRAQERTQRMSMLAGMSMLPTELETWGNRLQDVGSSMMGMGAMGGGMGSGGGANSFGASGAQAWNTPYFNSGDAAAIQQYGLE